MAASVAKLVQDFSLISAESQRNLGRKELADVGQILTRSGRDMGAVVCKRNRVYIFSRLSTLHDSDVAYNANRNKRQRDAWEEFSSLPIPLALRYDTIR